MNKLIRLGPTGIEYAKYAWNPYSGCRHKEQGKCPPMPCWAERIARRFPSKFPNGFEPAFHPEAFDSPLYLKKPSRILVCFMGDLFGDWVKPNEIRYIEHPSSRMGYTPRERIFDTVKKCPQHTFIFLTKNPAGMLGWGKFPDNCEAGFSAWSSDTFIEGLRELRNVDVKVKWCSLEPLLEWRYLPEDVFKYIDWVTIGALTGADVWAGASRYPGLKPMKLSEKGSRFGLMPPVEWLKEIVDSCDAAGTKVFLKDNLKPLFSGKDEPAWMIGWGNKPGELRRECGAREKK
jgi:protein gp37